LGKSNVEIQVSRKEGRACWMKADFKRGSTMRISLR
jgi:hypothetical protein